MSSSQGFNSPSRPSYTSNNSSYLSSPFKALGRLPSPFRTNSSSRSQSASRNTTQIRDMQPTNHDRMAPATSRRSRPRQSREENLISFSDDDDDNKTDDSFGDYEDANEYNSNHNSTYHSPAQPQYQYQSQHQYQPPPAKPNYTQFYTPSLHPTPSPRPTPPPFQPPPLTPLSLSGLSTSSRGADAQILSKLIAEEIRLLLPPRLQLVDTWRITFSLERDGASLKTLYEKCDDERGTRSGFVVVVRDAGGGIFGAYLTEPPYPSKGHYYGTGECFLWRSSLVNPIPTHARNERSQDNVREEALLADLLANLPPPPSEDTTNATRSTTLGRASISNGNGTANGNKGGVNGAGTGTSTPDRIRFKAFPYSGENDYMIFCESSFLSVGGGDGHYGLWLDAALERGISSPCPTFGNEGLSDESGKTGKFEVLGVEVWVVD